MEHLNMSHALQINNLQATSSVPAPTQPQLSYLETIIDKKIKNIALGCFEKIVHWFLTTFSCCCPSYKRRYEDQLSRIKYFSDGTVIKDLTPEKIVKVFSQKSDQNINIDYIALNNKKVLFTGFRNRIVLFGSQYFTDHVVVKDGKNYSGEVIITEYETTNTLDFATFIDLAQAA
jgi:hypothetical protein